MQNLSCTQTRCSCSMCNLLSEICRASLQVQTSESGCIWSTLPIGYSLHGFEAWGRLPTLPIRTDILAPVPSCRPGLHSLGQESRCNMVEQSGSHRFGLFLFIYWKLKGSACVTVNYEFAARTRPSGQFVSKYCIMLATPSLTGFQFSWSHGPLFGSMADFYSWEQPLLHRWCIRPSKVRSGLLVILA